MRDFRMLGGCVKMSFHHDSFLYVNVLCRILNIVFSTLAKISFQFKDSLVRLGLQKKREK
jgi:hypothetical protein